MSTGGNLGIYKRVLSFMHALTDICSMRRVLSILLLSLALCSAQGQEERFGAAIILGTNAAQLNGDNSAGFNKLGITAGIKGIAYLTERLDLNVEMLYSQRGSQFDLFGPDRDAFKINLDYLEIPVAISIKDWLISDNGDEFYKVHAHAGLSYARLISSQISDPAGVNDDVLNENFKDSDVSWFFGGGVMFTSHVGLSLRYTRALGLAYEDVNPVSGNTVVLKSYYLTFRGEYKF